MATKRWRGGSAAISQVTAYLFAGTWEATDVVNLTIGSKTVAVVTGSTVIATLLDTIVAAFTALSRTLYPEFGRITASRSSDSLVLTGQDPGVPFVCTVSTTETGGGGADAQTIDGAASSTGTDSTACSGPNFWSVAGNWDTGTVPVTGDAVILEDSAVGIYYGFAQSAVTLASLTINASFTGQLGLEATNKDTSASYPEYRATYLAIGATLCTIGAGSGPGAGLIKINFGTVQTTCVIHGSGSAIETNVEPIQLKGTHASNSISVFEGVVAIAGYGGDVATVANLQVGFDESQSSDAVVRCGVGTTLTTIKQTGGTLEINSAATTITKTNGTLTVNGAGGLTTLTDDAGTTFWRSTGTLATVTVGNDAVLTGEGDQRTKTITTANLYRGASFLMSEGNLATGTTFNFIRCSQRDVVVDLGPGRTLTLA